MVPRVGNHVFCSKRSELQEVRSRCSGFRVCAEIDPACCRCRTGLKSGSNESFYNAVALDVFKAPSSKLTHVCRFIDLPAIDEADGMQWLPLRCVRVAVYVFVSGLDVVPIDNGSKAASPKSKS